MKNLSQVIEFWKNDNMFPNLNVPKEVSVKTAVALCERGIAFYHRSTEDEDGYIEITEKGELFIINENSEKD
jgi:predicted transcriptional regulator